MTRTWSKKCSAVTIQRPFLNSRIDAFHVGTEGAGAPYMWKYDDRHVVMRIAILEPTVSIMYSESFIYEL